MDRNLNSDLRITYVAGNGHSGSTLLDMMLGTREGCFSAGELANVTRKSIFVEYCSCGATIDDCLVWHEVMKEWSSSRPTSLSIYRKLRHRYERNKTLPRLLLNLVLPSNDFLLYCAGTQSLFRAIQKATDAREIIDSSKSAARILILRRFAKLKVVHLTRNFTGVLNSVSKFSSKNLAKGIEENIYPTPPHRAFVSWFLNNLLVSLSSVGLKRYRVRYSDMVNKPKECLLRVGIESEESAYTKFSPEHMLAGNVIRLRKDLELDPNVGFVYRNLSKNKLRFGAFVDRLFFFWA